MKKPKRKKKQKCLQLEYLGDVCVDSGSLLLCDPCYLRGKRALRENRQATSSLAHEVDPETPGLGLIFDSFGGDGMFPVLAEVDGDTNEIKRITIELDRFIINKFFH